MSPSSAPFVLATAFSSSKFGGNPAAIVFLDPDTPLATLQGLSGNFYQPMAAFVKPPSPPSETLNVVRTSIRYITYQGHEIALCGHASLCAASAILALPEFQALDTKIELVEFETFVDKRIVPVRVARDGKLELGLPIAPPLEASEEEAKKVEGLVKHAFRNTGREVEVKKVMVGGKGFEHALLVEINPGAGLVDAKVDVSAFANTGYTQNVLTSTPSPSSTGDEEYIYRMFSPHIPGGEDSVCGSAQCLLAPYWHEKKQLEKGKEVKTLSTSPRGGVVHVVWERKDEKESVVLRGTTAFLGRGECYF